MKKNLRHDRPPILLFMGDYYGTLAAIRCLGREGIPVVLGEWRRWVPGAWSKYLTHVELCPPIDQTEKFLEWLHGYGRNNPGTVLYPTSDELAWLYAKHEATLSQVFIMHLPKEDCIYSLLNKQLLDRKCHGLNIPVPQTWFPESREQVELLASQLTYPVLIKPKTQILFQSRVKGSLVFSKDELQARIQSFMEGNSYGPLLEKNDPKVKWPMIQSFYESAAEGIYSISGYIGRNGAPSVFRASRKILQRPYRLGIGLCFESEALKPELVERIRLLCSKTGYYGAFEAEFIPYAENGTEEYLLTDFNPRFFSQMAFDLSRECPIPLYCYLDAVSKEGSHALQLQKSDNESSQMDHIYRHGFILSLFLWAQSLSGRMSRDEINRWKAWNKNSNVLSTDAVQDKADPWPAYIDLLLHLKHYLRHPRFFVRSFFFER